MTSLSSFSSPTVGSSQSIRPALLLQELSARERQGLPGSAETSRRKASQLATDLIWRQADTHRLADNQSFLQILHQQKGTSFTASTETAETPESSYTWGKQRKSLGFYEFPSGFMDVCNILKPLVFFCNKDCIKKSRLDRASIHEQKYWDLLFKLKGVQLWVRVCLGLRDHDQDRGIESYHIS